MTERVSRVGPPHTLIVPPEITAFLDLARNGIFDKSRPKGVTLTNWLDAPTEVLKGVGPATARLLAAKGIKTVRQVAQSRALWQREFPQAGETLAKAHAAISSAMQKYGLDQMRIGSLVDSPHSKPANVIGVQMQRGHGTRPTTLTVTYRTNDSAHQLVHSVSGDPGKITVRVADYRDPNLFGGPAITTKTATIDLGVLTTGATVEVVNRNGRKLFRGATPATSIPGLGGPRNR